MGVIPTSSEKRIQRLAGVVQPYPWGSPTAIPDLLGREPTGRPEAELWFGTHERGPSEVVLADGTSHRLADWIGRDPVTVLGAQEAGRFGSELPFLLKVLAAAAPLSIQAHPNREQARAGFERENAAGIPLDADRRCYRDPDPKPELICALSRFEALNRFREPPDIAERLAALSAPVLAPFVEALRRRPDAGGLSEVFTGLLGLPEPSRRDLVSRAAEHAARQSSEPAWGWVESLSARYPTDVGVLAPLLLNFVTLEPGQAMFLPAGELHSYLRGTGIEIMANSDNVLRGGLTDKHVDPGELTRTLTFRSGPVEVLAPVANEMGEARYPAPCEEFALSRIDLSNAKPFSSDGHRSIDILLCTEGGGRIESEEVLSFSRGDALMVPAAIGAYRIVGEGTVFRATTGRAA